MEDTMRFLFLMVCLALGWIGFKWSTTLHRSPASDKVYDYNKPHKEYSREEALDYGLDALKQAPQAKEVMDKAKRTGDAIVKDLESSVKDTVMEVPATVLVMGAKIAVDKKIQVSSDAPWSDDQKLRLTLRPDKSEIKWEGSDFLFIDGLQYGLSANTRAETIFNLNMEF